MLNDLKIDILPTFDNGGSLSVIENFLIKKNFSIKRSFYVQNVPVKEKRGSHAHYQTEQYIVCVRGRLIVILFDGNITKEFILEKNQGILIPKMIWDEQIFDIEDTILLCLANTNYDKSDYIEDKDLFVHLRKSYKNES